MSDILGLVEVNSRWEQADIEHLVEVPLQTCQQKGLLLAVIREPVVTRPWFTLAFIMVAITMAEQQVHWGRRAGYAVVRPFVRKAVQVWELQTARIVCPTQVVAAMSMSDIMATAAGTVAAVDIMAMVLHLAFVTITVAPVRLPSGVARISSE